MERKRTAPGIDPTILTQERNWLRKLKHALIEAQFAPIDDVGLLDDPEDIQERRVAAAVNATEQVIVSWNRESHDRPGDRGARALSVIELVLKLAPKDRFARDERERLVLNGKTGIIPAWNPVVFVAADDPRNHDVLDIEIIRTKRAKYEGGGFGRAVINVLQQALADTPLTIAHLAADHCYWPTFYTVDSHYQWWPSVSDVRWYGLTGDEEEDRIRKTAANATPPGLAALKEAVRLPPLFSFPRYWGVDPAELTRTQMVMRDDDDLPLLTPAQMTENTAARLEPINLCWSPPWAWHEARTRHVMRIAEGRDRELIARAEVVNAWQRSFAERSLLLARGQSIPVENPLSVLEEGSHRTFDVEHLRFRSLPKLLTSFWRDKIADALLGAGNDDRLDGNDIWVMFFRQVHEEDARPISLAIVLWQLAYLVDYGRVVKRPIVIPTTLVNDLRALAGDAESLQVWFLSLMSTLFDAFTCRPCGSRIGPIFSPSTHRILRPSETLRSGCPSQSPTRSRAGRLCRAAFACGCQRQNPNPNLPRS